MKTAAFSDGRPVLYNFLPFPGFFAGLISYGAAGLAGGLTRSLAFHAAGLLYVAVQLSFRNSLNMLHFL
jgi:hypothetical protein